MANLKYVELLEESIEKWNHWRMINPWLVPNLAEAYLKGTHLQEANLSRANLQGANLEETDLSRANLEGANLEGVDLSRANLEGANLSETNFEGAKLYGTIFHGANLDEAKNVNCNQINSKRNLEKETKFPYYFKVNLNGGKNWTCKEFKR